MTSIDPDLSILVVDDETAMLEIVGAYLRRFGCRQVVTCTDVPRARALLAAGDFDLVISDLQFNGPSGLDLLAGVRADPRLRHLRFIVMTASLAARPAREAAEAGIDAYLVKPFTPDALRRALEAATVAT